MGLSQDSVRSTQHVARQSTSLYSPHPTFSHTCLVFARPGAQRRKVGVERIPRSNSSASTSVLMEEDATVILLPSVDHPPTFMIAQATDLRLEFIDLG